MEDSPEEEDTPGTSQKKTKIQDTQPEEVDVEQMDDYESDEENKTTDPTNTRRPPPIIMRKKEAWTEISKTMKDKKINYTKARMAAGSIQIFPQNSDDHSNLKRLLTAKGMEYFTYATEEERIQKYVLKGIPEDMDTEDIYEELREEGFNIIKVQQMTSRRTKMKIPMYLIDMPNKEESRKIKNLTRCLGLVVTIEDAKRRSGPAQCHRCQGFHHAQNRCTSALKCVKCGLDHRAKECQLPKEESCTCANCGGPHPANYRGCPRAPKTLRRPEFLRTPGQGPAPTKPTRTTGPGPAPAKPATTTRRPGKSYSEATRGQSTGTPNIHEMMEKMAQFTQMMATMQEFFNKMMPQ